MRLDLPRVDVLHALNLAGYLDGCADAASARSSLPTSYCSCRPNAHTAAASNALCYGRRHFLLPEEDGNTPPWTQRRP
jgi:hypothetical protein